MCNRCCSGCRWHRATGWIVFSMKTLIDTCTGQGPIKRALGPCANGPMVSWSGELHTCMLMSSSIPAWLSVISREIERERERQASTLMSDVDVSNITILGHIGRSWLIWVLISQTSPSCAPIRNNNKWPRIKQHMTTHKNNKMIASVDQASPMYSWSLSNVCYFCCPEK